MRSTSWALLFFVFLTGCQSVIPVSTSTATEPPVPISDGLLFLSLLMEKTDEGIRTHITSTKITSGQLKRPNHQPFIAGETLIVDFLSEDDQVLASRRVAHPLRPSVETVNEDGRFERHQLNLDQGSIALRVPHFKSMKQLRISYPSGEVLSLIDLSL